MSFLTPLYVLGAIAIIGPVLFHLIRRAPKGEVPFSSLMFLMPTPPRLTRRSRLDNLLLLLLRAAALCLLAAAFARPFLRQVAQLGGGDTARRRIVILVDTSASMRRGDLASKARNQAAKVLADARPGDEIALLTFDATTRTVLGFNESATLDPARRAAVATSRLGALEPTWGSTDLGRALVDAVAAVEDVTENREKSGRVPRRVVLISDLQQGSRLDALGNFAWPSDVVLDLKTVAVDGPNAGLNALAETKDGEPAAKGTASNGRRVRVSNDAGSSREQFSLVWTDAKGVESGAPVEVYVPPGESRVVRIPEPIPVPAAMPTLRLKGDEFPFDNALYFADAPKEEVAVLFLGDDAPEDPAGLLYYLRRVFADTPKRAVKVEKAATTRPLLADQPGATTPLMILAGETSAETARGVSAYLKSGGTVLHVIKAPGKAETLATLAGVPAFETEEATVRRDAMLGPVAFDHPLFAAMAGAGFNDFTKIRFWKYRRLKPESMPGARVLARFENGDPAVLESAVGKGRLVVFTSGWQPADSQLARSSKFVPLMASLLDARDPNPFDASNVKVLDRVPLPPGDDANVARIVTKPSGASVQAKPADGPFVGTDEPGVYSVRSPGETRPVSFAVNLEPAESRTSPLPVETLEQFGCRLASPDREVIDPEQLRQMQNGELEGRQKLWRWLILVAIGVLIVETLLAGRLGRPGTNPTRAEVLAR